MAFSFRSGLYAAALVAGSVLTGVGAAVVHATGPAVTSVSPSSGTTEGLTAVVISGSGFTGATAVDFGTSVATLHPCPGTPPAGGCFTVANDTTINTLTPPHAAATVDVQVSVSGTLSPIIRPGDQYTYQAPPPLAASVSVSSATSGTPVQLAPPLGTNETDGWDFATSITFTPFSGSGSAVSIPNGSLCPSAQVRAPAQGCFSESNDQITFRVPAVPVADLGTTYDVHVVTAGGTSPATAADRFTFVRAFDTIDAYGTLHSVSGPGYLAAPAGSFGFKIARGLALVPGTANEGYILDGWGGVTPFGGASQLATSAYWRGWDIARGIAVFADGSGGYVLDGFGGLHPFGTAKNHPTPTGSAYWPGWDIARGLTLTPSGNGGWILDGWGGLHQFGDATAVAPSGYWYGWDIARAVTLTPDSTASTPGGYVLDGFGGLHPFGSAAAVTPSGYWQGWDIARAVTVTPDATSSRPSGYVLDGWGGLHQFGASASAPQVTPPSYTFNQDLARAVASI